MRKTTFEIVAENHASESSFGLTQHQEQSTKESETAACIDLMLAKAADESGLVPDMSSCELASLLLDKIIEEEDASAYDTWHHVFPSIGISRNDSIVDRYGLASTKPKEERFIQFPQNISFALGGVEINAKPKVLLVSQEDLDNFSIPDFQDQIRNAYNCIKATPKAEVDKIASIDIEMDLFLVAGEMRHQKTNLK